MSDICEHETFRDICGVCHRNTIIEKQETEITALRAVNDALSEQMMTMIDNAGKVAALRAENERLRAALERFASEFARVNPLRRATMHDPECRCLWCAYDNARAALQERVTPSCGCVFCDIGTPHPDGITCTKLEHSHAD